MSYFIVVWTLLLNICGLIGIGALNLLILPPLK